MIFRNGFTASLLALGLHVLSSIAVAPLPSAFAAEVCAPSEQNQSLKKTQSEIAQWLQLVPAPSASGIPDTVPEPDEATLEAFRALFTEKNASFFPSWPLNWESRKKLAEKRNQDSGLTVEERVALRGYTGEDYRFLNRVLRTPGHPQRALIEPYLIVLRSALSKLPDLEGEVRRWSNIPDKVLGQHEVGQLINFGGFTSTTTRKSLSSFDSQKVAYRIISKSGKDVHLISQAAEEAEVLFSPETQFKVIKITHQALSEQIEIQLEEMTPEDIEYEAVVKAGAKGRLPPIRALKPRTSLKVKLTPIPLLQAPLLKLISK